MRKTTTNKWYNLIEKRIQTDRNAKLTNPKENLITFLNPVEERGLFVSDKLRRIVYQILAEDTSLNARRVYYKLTQRDFDINLYRTRKFLNQLGYRWRKIRTKPKRKIIPEIETKRIAYINTIRGTNMQNFLFLDEIGFNFYTSANYRYSLDRAKLYHILLLIGIKIFYL